MQEKMRRLTSFFLLAMLFSIAFTVDADSDSNRFTLAPELVESCRALIRLRMVAGEPCIFSPKEHLHR